MYNEIIDKIRGLIDKMKLEKSIYDDFKKALIFYNDEKTKMEKDKRSKYNESSNRKIEIRF